MTRSALRATWVAAVLAMAAIFVGGVAFELQARAERPATPPGAKALRVGDAVRVHGRVLPGSSRYEGTRACVHRFALDTGKGQVAVEYPGCDFPEGFHRQRHLEVIVTGTRRGDALAAALVEPQLGGCCGGPHCYP